MAKTTRSGSGLVRMTLAEQAYEALKERILDQTLPAGARLNIDGLARDLEVSSSPIREALARLEAEKLVVMELFLGYSVAPNPTAEYIDNLLDYRILTESYCARIGAARRSAEVIRILRQATQRMATVDHIGTRYREYQKFILADNLFHQTLVDSAGNQVFSNTYASLHVIILQSRLYVRRDGGGSASLVVSEHQAILKAFEAGDGDAAANAVNHHLEAGRRRLVPLAAS